MHTQCAKCQQTFPLAEEDLQFYKKMVMPAPTHCPRCRDQRRHAWRNERTLYRRTCDATGEQILSVFSPDKPLKVYKNDYWYSDRWDPLEYGRDFDFSQPFFPQFKKLMQDTPQLALSGTGNQNSDYVNQAGWCKNCYLIFEADYNEDCMYANNLQDSKSCMDMLCCHTCQLCYECINCTNCYNLHFSTNCQQCSDSWFLKNCIGCKNCFGSMNLRNKEYYFFNEKCTKEEYETKLKAHTLASYGTLQQIKKDFHLRTQKFPHKYYQGTQNENSTGDYLNNTQNCHECYNVTNSQDCKFVTSSRNLKNVYDLTVFGAQKGVQFCYENHEVGEAVRNVCFSDQIWSGCYDIYYSKLCVNSSHHLFGCMGMRQQSYCIFNKKYTPEEYETLKNRIIEHMKTTGEWGEFFPITLSPFAYNETMAQEHYPLTKEAALASGYQWKDPDQKEYGPATYKIPDTLEGIDDQVVHELFACEQCGKNYKIVEMELAFYRKKNLPLPHHCHDCRHAHRYSQQNPRILHNRTCQNCQAAIVTTFPPDSPWIVYCEPCYQNAAE